MDSKKTCANCSSLQDYKIEPDMPWISEYEAIKVFEEILKKAKYNARNYKGAYKENLPALEEEIKKEIAEIMQTQKHPG